MEYDISIFKEIKEKESRIDLMLLFHRELSSWVEKLKNILMEKCLNEIKDLYIKEYDKLCELEKMIKEELK